MKSKAVKTISLTLPRKSYDLLVIQSIERNLYDTVISEEINQRKNETETTPFLPTISQDVLPAETADDLEELEAVIDSYNREEIHTNGDDEYRAEITGKNNEMDDLNDLLKDQ